MNRNNKVIEPIRVRVPQNLTLLSQSNPRNPCKRVSQCGSSKLLMQNYSNFKRSGGPTRIMFYQNGCWINFASQVVDFLRLGFVDGKPVVDAAIDGSNYLFDFLRMLQIDLATENQRSIAWIDEHGNCFFPKQSIEDDFTSAVEIPKIEIEIRIGSVSGVELNGRKEEVVKLNEDEDYDVASINGYEDVSKRQHLVTSEFESSRWPNTKLLMKGDGIYETLTNLFLNATKKIDFGVTITSIHQFSSHGPLEKARVGVFNKQMEIVEATRGASNTVYAWFGASAKVISEVFAHGFCGPSEYFGSDAHGIGVYLSPLASPYISDVRSEADDDGIRHIILCRVIQGKVEKVEAGSQQSYPSSTEFDTGADDPNNPKCYVIWCSLMNSHILPECVVSYKSFDRPTAKLGGGIRTKYTFQELFSKVKNSLSPWEVQELITLYKAFKTFCRSGRKWHPVPNMLLAASASLNFLLSRRAFSK